MHLGGHVLGFEVTGNLSDDAWPFIEKELGEFLEGSGEALLFWDAWRLERFGSRVRDGAVKLLVERRSQWKSVHVLVQSAVIGMTVSTIGLALFGRLKSHRDQDAFFTTVEQALTSG